MSSYRMPKEYATNWRRNSRRATRDFDVKRCGAEKTLRVDLGLALLQRIAVPGVSYTREEIAAFCGCTDSAIYQIEQTALKKLHNYLRFRDRTSLSELASEFFDKRRQTIRGVERMAA